MYVMRLGECHKHVPAASKRIECDSGSFKRIECDSGSFGLCTLLLIIIIIFFFFFLSIIHTFHPFTLSFPSASAAVAAVPLKSIRLGGNIKDSLYQGLTK
jgi:hypothetical protein